MSNAREIVAETITALEAMRRNGVTQVEVSRETLAELGKAPVQPARPALARPEAPRVPKFESLLPESQPNPPQETVKKGNIESDIAALAARAKACTKCSELARCRTNVVFGVGNLHAELMFIGEAPGADEDEQGEPFVGRAGQLLTKIIEAMGLSRDEVYIANVLKCRPPENRPPLPNEVANCLPFLQTQIDLIQPKVMVALGATAVKSLLDVELGITKMRGHWYTYRGIQIMPTFHPAYLLRNPPAKKEVWEDMKTVLKKLGREVPKKTA